MLFDRLFYRMNVIFRQCFETLQCIVWCKSSIGIYTQFNLFFAERLTDVSDEFKFFVEVNSTDFQLHTMKSLLKFSLYPLIHFIETPHPYKPIDAYAHFTSTERSVKKHCTSMSFQLCKSSFQAKKNARIRSQYVIGNLA